MSRSRRERAAALQVLGLPADATPEQIPGAYRHLARITHPDLVGATDRAAGDRFAAISDANHRLVTAPRQPPPARGAAEPAAAGPAAARPTSTSGATGARCDRRPPTDRGRPGHRHASGAREPSPGAPR